MADIFEWVGVEHDQGRAGRRLYTPERFGCSHEKCRITRRRQRLRQGEAGPHEKLQLPVERETPWARVRAGQQSGARIAERPDQCVLQLLEPVLHRRLLRRGKRREQP